MYCHQCNMEKSMRHKAKMAILAHGEAECYFSIKAECFFLHMACSRTML